jgi:hypothetical protein
MNKYFDEDQLPDELPADFADFDDEVPDELPADFIDFEEDRSLGWSVLEVPPPSVPQSSAAPARGFGSFQALEPLLQEERDRITAFAQALGATVTDVVPEGMPDRVFPRDVAHNWDTWRRRRDDRIFLRAREGWAQKSIYVAGAGKRKGKKQRTTAPESLAALPASDRAWLGEVCLPA